MAEPSSSPSSSPEISPPANDSSFLSRRSRQQLSFFFAGASFIYLTSILTRRAIIRRFQATIPTFFQQSNHPNEVVGSNEAVQALGLATMYVTSVGATFTAGMLWAFDISNLEELRYKVRKSVGVDTDWDKKDGEEELEEWIAGVLARKELRMFGGREFKERVRREFERERRESEEGGGGKVKSGE